MYKDLCVILTGSFIIFLILRQQQELQIMILKIVLPKPGCKGYIQYSVEAEC